MKAREELLILIFPKVGLTSRKVVESCMKTGNVSRDAEEGITD